MTTDHVKEALNELGQIGANLPYPSHPADGAVAIAQVHATLAVAEQLRIANLIALASLPEPDSHGEVRELLRGDALHTLAEWKRINPDDETPVIVPEIKEALGL